MDVSVLGVNKTLHVGHSDPTYFPKNPLNIPGLATINGPLVVGGVIDGQLPAPLATLSLLHIITPATVTADIPPTPTGFTPATTSALKISALGDGTIPYPGPGIVANALGHTISAGIPVPSAITGLNFLSLTLINLDATATISIKSPATTIWGGILTVNSSTFINKILNVDGPSLFNKVATFNSNVIFNRGYTANGSCAVNGSLTLSGVGDVATNIIQAKALPAKPFDIPHPSKLGHRLRHVSLEGPEICVFYRGKQSGNVIFLPEYWKDLVDESTITVHLTAINKSDSLYVDFIKNNQIYIVSDLPDPQYYYYVVAERKDLDKLIVEYPGWNVKDYPGQDFIGVNDVI